MPYIAPIYRHFDITLILNISRHYRIVFIFSLDRYFTLSLLSLRHFLSFFITFFFFFAFSLRYATMRGVSRRFDAARLSPLLRRAHACCRWWVCARKMRRRDAMRVMLCYARCARVMRDARFDDARFMPFLRFSVSFFFFAFSFFFAISLRYYIIDIFTLRFITIRLAISSFHW